MYPEDPQADAVIRRNRPLKAVAPVRIRSGLHPDPPVSAGGGPGGSLVLKITPFVILTTDRPHHEAARRGSERHAWWSSTRRTGWIRSSSRSSTVRRKNAESLARLRQRAAGAGHVTGQSLPMSGVTSAARRGHPAGAGPE